MGAFNRVFVFVFVFVICVCLSIKQLCGDVAADDKLYLFCFHLEKPSIAEGAFKIVFVFLVFTEGLSNTKKYYQRHNLLRLLSAYLVLSFDRIEHSETNTN